MKHLRTILAAIALLAFGAQATAQTIGEFTFTSPGIATNAVIYDPGSSTIELPSMIGNLDLYLSAVAVVNGKGTGNVTLIWSVSPDNVTWTSTNQTTHTMTFALDGATNASVIYTNIDVTGFRFLKLAGVQTDDEETAVTNLAVKYFSKRSRLN
jgi:hypothetical protein